MNNWISVEDKLPEKAETGKEYLNDYLVTMVMYDRRQRIWLLNPFIVSLIVYNLTK